MAEVSRGRGIFGRLLSAFGLAWVLWGFLGPLLGLQFGSSVADLPILPGIVILFIGRALARGSRRGESEPDQETRTERPVPARPEPPGKPAPEPAKSTRELRPVTGPVAVSDSIVETLEAPAPVPDDLPMRKTSAEMVAEARERYGRRP